MVFALLGASLSPSLQGEDCNWNHRDDASDISSGNSKDCNGNGIPDECDLLPIFQWRQPFGFLVSKLPYDIAALDLQGDGAMDVAISILDPGGIAVYTNDSMADLRLSHSHALPVPTSEVEGADLDLDGDTDLVALLSNLNEIAIFENDSGLLTAPIGIASGRGPSHLVARDIVGDARPDIITATGLEAGIHILRNEGDLGYQSLPLLALPDEPKSLAGGDMDGDGDLDLLTTSDVVEGGGIELLVIPNQGDGSFGNAAELTVPRNESDLEVADLDGDGLLDIAFTSNPGLHVLWNRPGGGFEPLWTHALVGGSSFVRAFEFDGDRDLDIGIASYNHMLILRNEGSRTFVDGPVLGEIEAFASLEPAREDRAAIAGLSRDGSGSLYVYAANADGTLRSGIRVETRFTYDDVLDADLDADGSTDLAAASRSSRLVSVIPNDGAGGFPRAHHFAAGGTATSLSSGDTDADGDVDLLIADEDASSIYFLTNDGAGGFERTADLLLPRQPTEVAPWDFDRDGDLDLALASAWTYSLVLLERSESGYSERFTKDFPDRVKTVRAADFDEDGIVELAFNNQGLEIAAWENETLERKSRVDTALAWFTETADVDGDGRLDLVSSVAPGAAWLIQRNLGSLTFERGTAVSALHSHMAILDLTGDGLMEAAAFGGHPDRVPAIFTLTAPASRDLDANRVPDECDLRLNDCNENGILDSDDVASGAYPDCNDNLLPDECDLQPALALAPPSFFDVGSTPRSITIADLDNDGHLDVVTADEASDTVSILMSDRSLTLKAPDTISIIASVPNERTASMPHQISAADLNADGAIDLVTTNAGSYSSSELGSSITTLWNQGDGSFATPESIPIGPGPRVALADMDGDADMDIVVTNSPEGALQVLVNEGGGAFASRSGSSLPASDLGVGDLDGDSDLDLIAVDYFRDVRLARNRGGADLEDAVSIDPTTKCFSVELFDFDGDGDLDVAPGYEGGIHLLLNDGSGNFTPAAEPLFAVNPFGLAASDLDGDGDMDLVSSSGVDYISIHPNLDGDRFGQIRDTPVGRHPIALAVGDMDRSGADDVVVTLAYHERDAVAVLLNFSAWSQDCDANSVPDECDLASGDLEDANGDGIPDACLLKLRFSSATPPPYTFHRGDSNTDGTLNISDPVLLLNHLFAGRFRLSCREAADFDNSGKLDISDAVGALNYLFLGGEPAAAPGSPDSLCGPDPDPPGSDGDLGCADYLPCS